MARKKLVTPSSAEEKLEDINDHENRDDFIFAPDHDGKLGDGITDEERTVLSGLGLNF